MLARVHVRQHDRLAVLDRAVDAIRDLRVAKDSPACQWEIAKGQVGLDVTHNGTIRESIAVVGGSSGRKRHKPAPIGDSRVTLHPLLITPMLIVMAPRTTTTVRVYPETRAEISRLAEAEGLTAAAFLDRMLALRADAELLDAMNAWDEAHADELHALAREPYPLDPDDIPPSPAR